MANPIIGTSLVKSRQNKIYEQVFCLPSSQFFVVNSICAICSHVRHIGFNDKSASYLEIKYSAIVIIGLQLPTYDIVGAYITTLDTQPCACIKLPSSCTVYSEFIILTKISYIIMSTNLKH